jgi:hypothetical protein
MQDVRVASPADKPAVMELLRLMARESAVFPADFDRVGQFVERCFSDGVVLVAPASGPVIGSMGMTIGQLWYSASWLLQEHWLYVHPAHRRGAHNGGSHAVNLLSAAKESAAELHIPLLAGVFTRGRRLESKCRLYRQHLRPVGQLFMGS